MVAQSTNFEAVYNDGLILQEKASQPGGSSEEQLDLLKQVWNFPVQQRLFAGFGQKLAFILNLALALNCPGNIGLSSYGGCHRHVTSTMRLGSSR